MKSVLRICCFLFLCLVYVSATNAQWKLVTLPNQRQMPVGNVHQTMQDRSGYIWYATDGGGVCRDNGYQIDVLREGLPSLQVTQIAEDTAGTIWVGTLNGLCRIEKKEKFAVHHFIHEPFASGCIDALAATSDGRIWVASGQIIGCFNTEGRCLKCYRSGNNRQSGKSVNSFYEDQKGRLWILETRGGLLCYDLGQSRFYRVPWDGYDPIEMLEDTVHHCYWIGTWNDGVVRLDEAGNGNRFPALRSAQSVTPRFNALDVCLSADCRTLFTTDMSMLRQWHIRPDGTLEEDLSIRQQLPPGRHILDKMDLDREGNVWVASYMPHTFILSSEQQRKEVATIPDLNRLMLMQADLRILPHNIIAEGSDLWLWQGRLGLVNYNPAFGMQLCSGVWAPVHLSRMEKCRLESGVWLAQGNGLYRAWRENRDLHLEQVTRMPWGENIYSIWDSGDGDLWIGASHGIFRYSHQNGRTEQIEHTDSEVLFLVTDADGRPHRLTASMMPAYSALGRDGDGTLWWGDNQGYIYRQDPQDSIPRMAYCAAAGETVNRICCDSLGHVWALTDQSVSECNPRTLAQRILSATDERLGIDFFRSICTVGDSVYIGSAGNVLRLASSDDLNRASVAAPPVISTLLCDSLMKLPGQEVMEIPYSTKVVEIRMTTLDILYAGHIRFAYRIRELSDEWITLPIGQNTLRLLLPSAGRYTLEARATDRYGVWSNPEKLLVIHKLPAWWQTRLAYTIYVLLGLSCIALAVGLFLTRQKRKHEQRMQEKLTELKFRFFTNISHELRTPLSLIITPLDSMISKGGNDALKPILRQAEHLLDMINRLLDFRKMETGNDRLQLRTGNLTEFLRMEADSFRPLAESRQVSMSLDVPDTDIYYTFDHSKMHHILSNLISNAIKYNREGGTVSLTLCMADDQAVSLSVRDTGIGIPRADQAHIFDRFYQAANHTQNIGTGIGLNMTFELVRLHGGELTVESVENEGSTFTVTLPVQTTFRDERLMDEAIPVAATAGGASILLVEDNAEFREFLAGELADMGYRVLKAGDGVEALKQLENNPDTDMIVSDIMMPRMSGVELCRKLKTDIKTSHIPIILLTARSGNENMLEGYDAGADLYLTKPFNIAILQNRIRHLLAQGEKRHQVFLQSVELKSEELADNDLDRQFIARAVELVEANMTNTDYSVEAFAGDLHTDRTNLYRKLQTLTGQKPSEFIRTIRLKHAAQLLRTSNYSISEIADLCGFSTPSYFTHSFKKMFGKTPGEYQKDGK